MYYLIETLEDIHSYASIKIRRNKLENISKLLKDKISIEKKQ